MTKRLLLTALAVALAGVLAACNGGLRPTLAEDAIPTPQPELNLELPAAPPSVAPLPATAADFPLEASVDDALIAWAQDRSVPYLDSCSLITPGPGELCDQPTTRDTVRLLGPTMDEVWYVVTVQESTGLDTAGGFRVERVEIAGR